MKAWLKLLTITGALSVSTASLSAADPRPTEPLRSVSTARVLADTPTVTAKAWAVLDGKTGAFLWGDQADEPMKSASTTKIMCAYVVLQLAAKDPKVLDEIVTFSKLADDTPGSTAAIKTGEKVAVKHCLYGLLLPSGNDAGNALAEHFSPRLDPPDAEMARSLGLDAEALRTRANFVAEMNRTARRIGLKTTKYRIPYGDGGTENDRTTTARELGTLAWTALQNDLFRKVVGTRKYECQVEKPDGTTRKASWTNTNKLLGKHGIHGVKTGTTTVARACLVAAAARGDDKLITVVLGSKADADRYADTEAILKWAWDRRDASTK